MQEIGPIASAGIGDFFAENLGQIRDGDIRYYIALGAMHVGFGPGYVLVRLLDRRDETSGPGGLPHVLLSDSPISPSIASAIVRLGFEGANSVVPIGRGELPHRSHFFLGSDPTKWRTDVRSYQEVFYEELYDGVDLLYRTERGSLKYEFLVRPGSDPSKIRVSYAGVEGMTVGANGDLEVRTEVGEIRDSAPLCTQEQRPVPCAFELRDAGASVGLSANWDRSLPLRIDPLVFCTYVGAGGVDDSRRMAVDAEGNVYLAGFTDSVDFPVAPGLDSTLNGTWDAFVAKLDATGRFLRYATYLGGSGSDYGFFDIAIDSLGQAYIVGSTESKDFPVTPDAFDASENGTWDAFLARLDPAGKLAYGTYVGGSTWDYGNALAVDPLGDVIVAGETGSPDFPTTAGAFDTSPNGERDIFVLRLGQTGSLQYGTLLGGTERDFVLDIDLDPLGSVLVAGYTVSMDFPTSPFAHDRTYGGGFVDGFAAKVTPDGSRLQFGTYLGGVSSESATGIRAGPGGTAYVVGSTGSRDFPTTPGAYDRVLSGSDTFVAELSEFGGLVFSTLLGVSANTYGESIDVDAAGNAYVVGTTDSAGFPTTPDAFDRTCGTDGACNYDGVRRFFDASLTKLSSDGSAVLYATFLGGSDAEWGMAVVLESPRRVVVSGVTWSPDFPTTPDAFDTSANGEYDSFVVNLDFGGANTPPTLSWDGSPGFEADGVNPELGTTRDVFTYSVLYSDADDDAPAVIDLIVERPLGSTWRTIPMTFRRWAGTPGDFAGGASFVAETTLPAGTDYWYRFRASDSLASATGAPTGPLDAPDVIADDPPTAIAVVSSSPAWRGAPLSFDASGSYDDFGIVAYEWDFGDGAAGTGPIVQHSYTLLGTYTATLTIWDLAIQSDTDSLTIEIVNRAPSANAGPHRTGEKHLSVTLDGTGSSDPDEDPLAFAWSQVSGPIVSLDHADRATPTFTPTEKGVYTFRLSVTDGWGGQGDDLVNVTIVNRPPVAVLAANVSLATVGTLVSFVGTGSYDPDGTVVGYAFDFGDTASEGGSAATRVHAYTRAGTYTVTMTVTDNDGDTGVAHLSVNVRPVEGTSGGTTAGTEMNWKPLVAAVFAAALAIVGAVSSRRRPWRRGTTRTAAAQAFALTALPFVVAEAATAVVSFFTGLLAIPPSLGAGTAVDLTIVVAGLAVTVFRSRKPQG